MLVEKEIKDIYIERDSGSYLNENTIAYYPLTEDLLDHKTNQQTLFPLSVSGSWYSFTTNADGYKAINLIWSTYLYPWSGNVRGKHPWTDDMTIAFRVSGYTSPSYWTIDWSWYHSWILNFNTNFKTGISSDWSIWMYVWLVDQGYEWFNWAAWYDYDKSTTPPTVKGKTTGQTYLDSFLSVVDTFSNWQHTRYVSTRGPNEKYYESTYAWGRTVSVNYIWWDNYSSSDYRYFRWYMRDFVVAWDVWTTDMINAYFNEELS